MAARVLKGNTKLVGKSGGFSTPQSEVAVTKYSAAIIPSQFHTTKAALRPYLERIRATVDGVPLFASVADVIDNARSPVHGLTTQQALESLNPGRVIIEVVGLAHDMGTRKVVIWAPKQVPCARP